MTQPDVLIVGAGLAGLACARHLDRRGHSFVLLDAADAVGGRVRTDEVDGFLLDRGFQVLLTAYPEAQALLDYDLLGLRSFYDGALVYVGGRLHRVADPIRRPLAAAATLLAPVGTLEDKLRVARLRAALLRGSLTDLFDREETTTLDALRRRWGFSDRMIDRFFRPFFGGIFFDRDLTASSRMFEFVFRMFAEGRAALPAGGMEAIPRQLAAPLPPEAIRLNTRVRHVEPGRVTLDDGTTLEAPAVVVATEAPAAAALLGERAAIRPTAYRSTTCLYFSAETPPVPEGVLILDGEGTGPVNNVSVLTNVAPTYGPVGRALVSAVVLGDPADDDETLERAVRRQLLLWFGPAVQTWAHLRTYRIRYALPEQAPPFLTPPERPVRLGDGLYVCGDHRATASIHGALRSGRHAGEAVALDLAPVPG
ncbi:MAG: FAD-dependent oxidoreductase [Bacteroidetes bacterium]|nr:MAG: FAD-dependent oxidoreductase [Bacteroidota bacterium]